MKRALVTGASGGFGACIARRLTGAGLMIQAHAHRHPERTEATCHLSGQSINENGAMA